MSDSLKHTLFNETECISEQTLFDYIDKKLSEKENHIVEKHMLHCELCSDALEGLQLIKNREHIRIINQKINERIVSPFKETKIVAFNYKIILSVAATLLLLIGGVFFFNMLNHKDEMAVKLEQTATEPPPPPPMPVTADDFETNAANKEEESAKTDQSLLLTKEAPLILEEPIAPADQKKTFEGGSVSDVSEDDASDLDGLVSSEMSVGGATGENKNTPAPAKAIYDDVLNLQQSAKASKQDELQKNESAGMALEKDKSDVAMSAPSSISQPEYKVSSRSRDRDPEDEVSVKSSQKKEQSEKQEMKEKRKRAESENQHVAYAPKSTTPMEEAEETPQTVSFSGNIEQNPVYPGGQDSLTRFIQKNIKPSVLQNNQQFFDQTVQVEFTINKDGYLKNPKITKGINAEMDEEIIRILNTSLKWTPGRNANGESISKKISIPVRLK